MGVLLGPSLIRSSNGAITSSLALGLLQTIFFAKEPLGHLEKTTPEAVISPCP